MSSAKAQEILGAPLNQGSGASPDSPGFEGVEKVLELDFAPGHGPPRGLLEISRSDWDAVLTDAKCSILGTLCNATVESYILSESSLFVYAQKVIIKTCGTTTLLMCLPRLLEITAKMSMRVEWLAYTRKDFKFPWAQQYPHRGPREEIDYLKQMFPEGSAFLMGPVTSDHWLVFVADYVDRSTNECVDRTLDMMMFDLDPEVAQQFIKDGSKHATAADVSKASGITSLLPGSLIQDYVFDPCGYSMNGLLFDAYWTIHITPESHCSYASFETNLRLVNYAPLVKAVLAIFRPKRFTMTLFADEEGLKQIKGPTTFPLLWSVPNRVAEAAGGVGGGGSGGARGVDPNAVVEVSRLEDGNCVANVGEGGAEAAGGSTSSTSSSSSSAAAAPLSSSSPSNVLSSYVQTHKSMSEFMGYKAEMGNYCLVNVGAEGEDVVALKATETLSMPRAKYILPHAQLAERVSSLRMRVRKESI